MTEYDRDEAACHLCFQDKVLQDWIKEEGRKGGVCPWCGRRGYIIGLAKLSEPFREVASIYVEVNGPEAYQRGECISTLLDEDWGVFSERIQCDDLTQDLALAILYADLEPRERLDYPDYSGFFFRSHGSSLEENWDAKAHAALAGDMPEPDTQDVKSIERDIDDEHPDWIQIAFEDLSIDFDAGKVLHRARIHDKDWTRKERFQSVDLRPPPPKKATSGRANRKGRPVLYLASSRSTALAEVRAWKAVALAEVTTKRPLFLVDLSRGRWIGSPFFVQELKWTIELAGLLRRLAGDMSRPVMPHEEEVLYRPTQFLALLIKLSRCRYGGFIYPSAMGSGTNVVLFNPDDVEIGLPEYVRVERAAYFSEPLDLYDEVYEEGPYDFALERESRELLALCEAILEDNEVTVAEVSRLGEWLKLHELARLTWPGKLLTEPIQAVLLDGKVNKTELRRVSTLLRQVQKDWAKRQQQKVEQDTIDRAKSAARAMDLSQARLPCIPVTLHVNSRTDRTLQYTVDLAGPSCTCPDWWSNRSRLPPSDLTRACKHVFDAFGQVRPRDGWPGWMESFLEHGWRPHPQTRWLVSYVNGQHVLISNAPDRWANVFSPVGGSYRRFGYNVAEKRWSYGTEPPAAGVIARTISRGFQGDEKRGIAGFFSRLFKG
jgi:hypothetical protein